jgi:hypothetical protein
MKRIIGLSLVIAATLVSCNSTPKKNTEKKTTEPTAELASSCCSKTKTKSCCNKTETKVTAYYFHNTRRCVTCETVESVAREVLKIDNINLKSINLEEAEGKALAEQLGVSGQTLLIVAGDKKENLTNFAFLNARSNPELLKSKIKACVAELNK